jgi:hypothetical protein
METVTHQDRVAVRSRAQQGLIENADVEQVTGTECLNIGKGMPPALRRR